MAFYLHEVLEQKSGSLDKGDDKHARFAFPRQMYFWMTVSDDKSSELHWIALVMADVSETRAKTDSLNLI